MSRALWWCLLALASCCRGSPVGEVTSCKDSEDDCPPPVRHGTTCEEFGSGATVDPQQLVGNWTPVYVWMPMTANKSSITLTITRVIKSMTITELTSSELEQFHNIVKDYPESSLKLKIMSHHDMVLVPRRLDNHTLHIEPKQRIMVGVLIPTDSFGNTVLRAVNTNRIPITIKYQRVDGFQILMECQVKRAYVIADTSAPDEAKLQKVVADVHFEGRAGRKFAGDFF